ncbi:MAG: NADP-specific glutamate dehydrogenase [Pseudomonadota bacterium]
MSKRHSSLDDFMTKLSDRNPHQDEFLQSVREVAEHILPLVEENADYREAALMERLTEPDRVISFRVAWERDDHSVAVNRGYRVQFNSAIGPYKGGLRFHPSVNQSVLKFLGFEQTFKNALTGLPMGGGKGGSDFNPKRCSDAEIRRFCTAFMTELHRHIGGDLDIPAGDINVGAREIGYLFGAFRRITNQFEGAMTGKGLSYGGSEMRTEATGHGLVHFLCHMMNAHGSSVDGKTIVISGAGNVATYAAEKALELGGKVVTLSDSAGFIYDKDGLDEEKIAWVREHKAKSGASLEAYADKFDANWHEGKAPWGVKCDIALPCATQNELGEDDAKALINNGCAAVAEGANMPSTPEAVAVFADQKVLFAPAKAANAGGVAVSGLEISQNKQRRVASREDVQEDLRAIMKDIHDRCAAEGGEGDIVDYRRGANVASFKKVADAMLAQGIG